MRQQKNSREEQTRGNHETATIYGNDKITKSGHRYKRWRHSTHLYLQFTLSGNKKRISSEQGYRLQTQ